MLNPEHRLRDIFGIHIQAPHELLSYVSLSFAHNQKSCHISGKLKEDDCQSECDQCDCLLSVSWERKIHILDTEISPMMQSCASSWHGLYLLYAFHCMLPLPLSSSVDSHGTVVLRLLSFLVIHRDTSPGSLQLSALYAVSWPQPLGHPNHKENCTFCF